MTNNQGKKPDDKLADPYNYSFVGHDVGCPRCQGYNLSEITVLREHNERWLSRIADLEEAFKKMRAIYVENNETEALDKMVDIIEKVLRHG